MGVQLNVIGKIDLEALNQSSYRPVDPSQPFKILSIKVSFWEQESLLLDFGEIEDENVDGDRYFSLFIGKNGLGKSMFLCEIIEFLVAASKGSNLVSTKKMVNIQAMTYTIGGRRFTVTRNGEGDFIYQDGLKTIRRNKVEFPLIIASTMGMFDKFPLSTYSWKKGYYNVDFYRYVGPKANTNLYSTKTNLMFQMLGNLRDLKRKQQMTKVAEILNFIGYDSKITVKYKIKTTAEESSGNTKGLKSSTRAYMDSMKKGEVLEESVDFRKDTMPHVRQMYFREIGEMKQKGFLTSYECYLYQNGTPIECNHLSSGEFNMLSMVMSVVMTSKKTHLLILLDEPEISHHPNWQMEIIDNLDCALSDYKCHFLIATHSHFLVSDLPLGRSTVMDIERYPDGKIEINKLLADTYGWSAEEVLLKAFKMPTDRNKYLAEIVGKLMSGIADKSIKREDVNEQLQFLKKVSIHLSDVDPMKEIISTIIGTFERYD